MSWQLSPPSSPQVQPSAAYLFAQAQSEQVSAAQFLPFPPLGQGEATGRPHSENFLEPEGKGPFCEFLCDPAPAATRLGGSRLGPGLGGLGGSVAGVLPRRSRVPRPRAPRALPLQRPGDPGDPVVLHAGAPPRVGVRPRDPPDPPLWPRALAHSIRTCRRTLSITEATT